MKERLEALRREIKSLMTKFDELTKKSDASDEDVAAAEQALTDAKARKVEAEKIERLLASTDDAADLKTWMAAPDPTTTLPPAGEQATETAPVTPAEPVVRVPATVKTLRLKCFQKPEDAYLAGHFVNAMVLRSSDPAHAAKKAKSERILREHGEAIERHRAAYKSAMKAQNETVNTEGGATVPEVLSSSMIRLVETYGAARQGAQNWPMTSDTLNIPRRTGGLTAYWVTDNTAITTSTMNWDRVGLNAKKTGVLAKWSSEWEEDTVVAAADALGFELSWALIKQEDDCLFLGDGSATYAGMTGLSQKFSDDLVAAGASFTANYAYHPSIEGTAGINLWTEVTLTHIMGLMGKVAGYAYTPNAKFYCNSGFAYSVLARLAASQGGVTLTETVNGQPQMRFLGYPVVMAQSMPAASVDSTIHCYFGDLSQAVAFGSRREITIATSEHLNFAEDELAIRATERFDVNVHDTGQASSTATFTATTRVKGPIAALLLTT